MRPSPPDNSPEARQRADARLRRLTRSAAVLATGATFAIGVVVAKEHPGASAPSTPGPVEAPGTSVPTTSTLGSSTTTTAPPPSTSPTSSIVGSSPGTSAPTTTPPPPTTTTSPPTTTTTRPVITSGGTSR